MANLIDSNCFIEAHQRHYPFDYCPGFWDWLIRENSVGNIFSIDKVEQELISATDALSVWAKDRGTNFFVPVDAVTLLQYSNIAAWVSMPGKYAPANLATFLSGADPWLLAHALAHGHTIVTHEALVDASSKKVKIPNVCTNFNVPTVRIHDVIRQSGAKLVLL